MTRFIFCTDPLSPRQPDELFQAEVEAVRSLGLEHSLINYEALVNEQNLNRAVSLVTETPSEQLGIYRGWMLRPPQYSQLYQALKRKGIRLINDPAAYKHCHYLPESYRVIEPYTPLSIWTEASAPMDGRQLADLLQPFAGKPIIVKDFVKSQKHYWLEACYMPSAADLEHVERVVNRFLELQGDSLNEGLVFREFVEFEPLAQHSKSQMPLSREYRVFVLDGEPVQVSEYWEEGNYEGEPPPLDHFRDVMRQVQSRFFTMDMARRLDGHWMIVELGDAQVAGLPERLDPLNFYRPLAQHLTN